MDEIKTTQQMLVAVPQITKKDFIEEIANALDQYKWSKRIVECMNPDDIRLVYVKGYHFKGTAEGSWTAKVDGSKDITVNKKKVPIADGTPYAGPIPEIDFSISIINDNQATPYWAKQFNKTAFSNDKFMPISYISSSGGIIVGEDSDNPFSAWMKYGNEIIDNYLKPIAVDMSMNGAVAYLALNILPADVVSQMKDMLSKMKFNSRDVVVSTRNSVTEDPNPVLIPFFVFEFQYEGKTYHITKMAEPNGGFRAQMPPVNDGIMTPLEILDVELPEKKKKAKLIKWGWLLALLALIVTNFKIAFICLIAWVIGYLYIKHSINSTVRQLNSLEDERRRNNQAKIKKQLLR